MKTATPARALAFLVALAAAAILLAACSRSRDGGSLPKNPALDRKLERLVALILDVERRGAGDDDAAAIEASQIIAGFGGPDSTAKVLSERLLRDADRWIPVLDSLSRVPAPSANATPPVGPARVAAPPGT